MFPWHGDPRLQGWNWECPPQLGEGSVPPFGPAGTGGTSMGTSTPRAEKNLCFFLKTDPGTGATILCDTPAGIVPSLECHGRAEVQPCPQGDTGGCWHHPICRKSFAEPAGAAEGVTPLWGGRGTNEEVAPGPGTLVAQFPK